MSLDFTKGVIDLNKSIFTISCTDPGKPTNASWDEPRVKERVKQNGSWLSILKYGKTPYDEDWGKSGINTYTSTLNPRVEAVTKSGVFEQGIVYKSGFKFRVPRNPEYYAVIYQIMSREKDGKTPLPIFHFIVKQSKLWLRYCEIENGKRKKLVYVDLGVFYFDTWYDMEVRFLLAPQRGWFEVYKQGKLIWGKRDFQTSASPEKSKLTFGVYGYPGKGDMSLHVAKISYSYLKAADPAPKSSPQLIIAECKCENK